jgi:hypothetical protein
MPQRDMFAKKLRIERTYPLDLQTHFVTHFVVQGQPEYFIMSFFELLPPPILGDTEEEKRQQLEAMASIEAKCVARLVVPSDAMREFIETVSQNYENWQQRMAEEANDAEMDT